MNAVTRLRHAGATGRAGAQPPWYDLASAGTTVPRPVHANSPGDSRHGVDLRGQQAPPGPVKKYRDSRLEPDALRRHPRALAGHLALARRQDAVHASSQGEVAMALP